tara:strand:+ start:1834 stop:2814 length:981 start_codon:yes stop_codon:yes gene_type:complete
MAIAASYITHQELKRIFPQMDEFDQKTQIFGWTTTDTPNQYQANDTGLITQLYFDGVEGTAVTDSPNALYEFNYSSTTDSVQIFLTTSGGATLNPNDILVEAGEDFSSMVAQYISDASRYFDSRVDPALPKEQLKDKSGNFDYMVIRTVGLIAACFLIKSKNHNSELAQSFMEEAEKNIDLLNEGKAALSWQNTSDAAQGFVRDVTYTSGKIRPVDTRGEYSGSWDLIKVKIGTGGVIGTATYNVFTKDTDGLKNNQVVTDEKITGDYQPLTSGLQIRFAGATDDTVAAANDEWEIEVTGRQEYVDTSDMKSVKLTRSGTIRRYYK